MDEFHHHSVIASNSPPPLLQCRLCCPALYESQWDCQVDEKRPKHRGNEKSACYGAVTVYSTLTACPMGLLSSSRPYTLLHVCVYNPSSSLAAHTILQPRMESPPKPAPDCWKEKTESEGWRVKDTGGENKEMKGVRPDRGLAKLSWKPTRYLSMHRKTHLVTGT